MKLPITFSWVISHPAGERVDPEVYWRYATFG